MRTIERIREDRVQINATLKRHLWAIWTSGMTVASFVFGNFIWRKISGD